ncbi:hypothetical protein C8J57DRAFT_271360 [Mycena rebaudengoi]|nr:hypothetical protein C8J57DRAFT_271360 [Mycena rebaudengoi]
MGVLSASCPWCGASASCSKKKETQNTRQRTSLSASPLPPLTFRLALDAVRSCKHRASVEAKHKLEMSRQLRLQTHCTSAVYSSLLAVPGYTSAPPPPAYSAMHLPAVRSVKPLPPAASHSPSSVYQYPCFAALEQCISQLPPAPQHLETDLDCHLEQVSIHTTLRPRV